MKTNKNQHVIPHSEKGWAVKKSGSDKVTKTFSTQQQAEKFAKEVAKRNKSELFIHSKTGKIRERNTYGKDKMPPRG